MEEEGSGSAAAGLGWEGSGSAAAGLGSEAVATATRGLVDREKFGQGR